MRSLRGEEGGGEATGAAASAWLQQSGRLSLDRLGERDLDSLEDMVAMAIVCGLSDAIYMHTKLRVVNCMEVAVQEGLRREPVRHESSRELRGRIA